MKYENGRDIFPAALLEQVQRYAAGKLVYIPAGKHKRAWGESSGHKRFLVKRNLNIRAKFRQGTGIEALADEYGLSVESVKKIVYSKKEVRLLDYKCTLSSAQAYAEAGKLEEWVHIYLLSDGHNKEFSDGLKLFNRFFLGPVKMPLKLFTRCCGPEAGMKYRITSEAWFEQHVANLMEAIRTNDDMPPLIVHYVEGGFELNDGNHRHEAYARLGIEESYVIVWITEQAEYDEFIQRYGQYLP